MQFSKLVIPLKLSPYYIVIVKNVPSCSIIGFIIYFTGLHTELFHNTTKHTKKNIVKPATQKFTPSDKRNSLCHLETSERDLPYFKSHFQGSTKLIRNPCLILFISKLTSRHSPCSK